MIKGGPGADASLRHRHRLLPLLGLHTKVTEGQHSSLDSKGNNNVYKSGIKLIYSLLILRGSLFIDI